MRRRDEGTFSSPFCGFGGRGVGSRPSISLLRMQTHLCRPARSGIQPCAPGAEIQACHRGGRNPWLLFTSVCSCSSTHSGNIPHFGLTPTKVSACQSRESSLNALHVAPWRFLCFFMLMHFVAVAKSADAQTGEMSPPGQSQLPPQQPD